MGVGKARPLARTGRGEGESAAILERLRLTAHEAETRVAPIEARIPQLGWLTFPTHCRLKRRNAVGFARRYRENRARYARGKISFAELDATVRGWIGQVAFGDTWGLRARLLGAPIRPP